MLIIFLLIPVSNPAALEPLESWAEILIAQYQNNEPLPVLSTYGAELDLSAAYYLQRRFVAARLKDDEVAGYKAELTNPPRRYPFGIDEPVAGILLASGDIKGRLEINIDEYRNPVIEMEIGFTLVAVIDKPIPDVVRLKPLIRDAFPVVELPDLYYEEPAKLTGTDIIATNVAAASYVVGRPLRLVNEKAVNGIFVELLYDGKVVDRGKATNAMGNQFDALLWLVNQTVAQGRVIRPGQLLITGALGDRVPARAGVYTARYRDVQDMRFRLKASSKGGRGGRSER